jgi:hypothetical protein
MAEQLNYQINIEGNANQSVGSLKKQLREATAEVAILSDKFGATSKEAIEAAKRAAELRDRIGDARALTEAFNPDAKFKALSASLTGVAGGFAAVQGAIGLFGAESKELEKQLLKVQSALALSQGLQSIGESIDSFKQLGAVIQSTTLFTKANAAANTATTATMNALGIAVNTTSTSFRVLKTAIAATGIGLAVIAISELISAISSYTSAAEKAKEAQDKLNESIKKGAETALSAELESINKTEQLLIAEAKLRGESADRIYKIEQESRNLRIKARQRYQSEIEQIDADAANKNANEIKKEQTDIRIGEINFQIEQKNKKQKHNEDLAKIEEDRTKKELEEQKKRQEQVLQAESNAFQLQLQAAENKTKKQQEDAASEDAFMQEQFDKENARLQVQIDNRNKVAETEKAIGDAELQARQQLEDAKFSAASAGINALGALAGENEKFANALLVVDKALAVAKIVIDTQREIRGYWSNPTWSALPDGGATIKTIYSAAAGIRAAASVATIASTTIAKFKGGSTAANFGQGGAITTTGAPVIPQQQVTTTQLNQATLNALGNAAIRAYVVETDITASQQRIAAIKQRARFG